MSNFSDTIYAHCFNLLPEIGPARLYKIGQYFETFEEAFMADPKILAQCGIEEPLIDKLKILRTQTDLTAEVKNLANEQIKILTYKDANYPKLLLETKRFPAILYYKGSFPASEEICLGVVGTRKISNYGRTVLPGILEPIIASGVTIVSGLAYGIDALAHELTVNLNKKTIAILGGGLDAKSIYPQNHCLLVDRILENNGCLISEYPPKTPNLKFHIVARDRIISGLSLGTLVVECNLNSGSLITAEFALEQNRSVYAIPGPIYSQNSLGPHSLIKMGAKMVTTSEDILLDLNLPITTSVLETDNQFSLSPTEKLLLEHLTHEPQDLNQLIKKSGLDSPAAIAALTFLEMKGKIRNLGAQQYILNK